jgi:hypothetical protein
MRIIGIFAARNESWCIGLTLRAALMWLDEVVVLDHCSTDSTMRIIIDVAEEHPNRVGVLTESNPIWEEMRHRQKMLDAARQRGATHICYIDADEILTGDMLDPVPGQTAQRIRGLFSILQANHIMQIPWLAMRGSIGQVHVAGPWADGQVASFGFLDDPRLGWTSSTRGGYDFHHRQPMGKPLIPWTPLAYQGRRSGLMHLQFLQGRRLRAKQLAYCFQEFSRWPGRETKEVIRKRYSLAVYGQTEPSGDPPKGLGPAPLERWWGPYAHLMKHLDLKQEPWQVEQCRQFMRDYPGIEEGFDDFGLFSESFYNRSNAQLDSSSTAPVGTETPHR